MYFTSNLVVLVLNTAIFKVLLTLLNASNWLTCIVTGDMFVLCFCFKLCLFRSVPFSFSLLIFSPLTWKTEILCTIPHLFASHTSLITKSKQKFLVSVSIVCSSMQQKKHRISLLPLPFYSCLLPHHWWIKKMFLGLLRSLSHQALSLFSTISTLCFSPHHSNNCDKASYTLVPLSSVFPVFLF